MEPFIFFQVAQKGIRLIEDAMFCGVTQMQLKPMPLLSRACLPPGGKNQRQRWFPSGPSAVFIGKHFPQFFPSDRLRAYPPIFRTEAEYGLELNALFAVSHVITR